MKNLNNEYYLNQVRVVDGKNEQYQETCLENAGWVKNLKIIRLSRGWFRFMKPTKLSYGLVRKESYVKRIYTLSAPKNCGVCNDKVARGLMDEKDYCARIRTLSLKSSPYVRYFCGSSNQGGDFVTALSDTSAPCYHLKSESMIDKEAIFQLYRRKNKLYT